MRRLPVPMSGEADIRVEDAGAPDVAASTGQLVQVVVNLLANAVKASRPGERARVTLVVGPGSPGTARIEVIDQGVGIAPELQQRISTRSSRRVRWGRGWGSACPCATPRDRARRYPDREERARPGLDVPRGAAGDDCRRVKRRRIALVFATPNPHPDSVADRHRPRPAGRASRPGRHSDEGRGLPASLTAWPRGGKD